MQLQLTAEQASWRDHVASFATERLAAGALERARAHDIEPSVMRELACEGLLGVNVPASLGGKQLGAVAYALAVREVASRDAAVAVTMAVTNMVAEVITHYGTTAQKREHVPKLTGGDYFAGAFALSEPASGSDAASLSTRATLADDHWLIGGEKMWISHGDKHGIIVLWARTGEAGPRGISCFLLPSNSPGLLPGKPEEKMGLRASHTVALALDEVRLPQDALLGDLGRGFNVAMTALDGGRIGVAAQAVGIAAAAMARARELVLQVAGHSDIEQQRQFELADMATSLEAAWLMVLRAAWLKEQGRAFSKEAAMAKVKATESANCIVRAAHRLAASCDAPADPEIVRLVRDCRVTQIYEGTSEVQRVVIARKVRDSGVLP